MPDAEGDVLAPDEALDLEQAALAQEEKDDIASLLEQIRQLPPDTKADRLSKELEKLRADGYSQTMVFTQYTDTMDFLRDELAAKTSLRVMCFSGRGGEVRETDGRWRTISREEAKRRFRTGQADVLLCTDAASEGLNFQFCGSLINYDMPWNPMRVEQRIGRIDRLGQQHAKIRIVNLHYEGTVEADVYMALRHRINLFESVVGRLQPILAKLPGVIAGHVLTRHSSDPDARSALAGDLEQQAEAAKQDGFDLDLVLQRADSWPLGLVVKKLQDGEYAYQSPGMAKPVRITTRPDYFDDHSDSLELWSPGSPSFPAPEVEANPQELADITIPALLRH
jgi:superfamily II DNA/RNA helicase